MLTRTRRAAAAMLVASVVAAAAGASAGAQTDADLGCGYRLAPQGEGAASYTNPLRLDITDCTYEWDQFHVEVSAGDELGVGQVTPGFDCAEGRDQVICGRGEAHTGGAFATLRPSCGPGGGDVTVTLVVSGRAAPSRRAAPRTFACAPPSVVVLRPPRRQRLASALRRGVLLRFSCQTACTADAALSVPARAEVGSVVGEAKARRAAGGTYSMRVRPDRRTRRKWRRRRSVEVLTSIFLQAASGEVAQGGSHIVRLRR